MTPIAFSSSRPNRHQPQVRDISADELATKAKDVLIVDVRENDEFVGPLGHIEGSKHVVLDTLPDRLKELPKEKTIVFVCKSGGRSGSATAFATEQGYTDVYNMAGGMLHWNELGLPIQK